MNWLLQQWIGICMLRTRPQDLPASTGFLLVSVVAYLATNLVLSLANESFSRALLTALLDLAVLYIFVRISLLVRRVPERLTQTLGALTGSGAILALLAAPLLILARPDTGVAVVPAVLWLPLVIWSVGVFGHVMRHALDIPFPAGILMAIAYLVISVRVMQRLLPPISS